MKRIGLRKTLLISFAFLFTLCIAAFGISLVPETARAVPSSAEKTVTATQAYAVNADGTHTDFISNPTSGTMKRLKSAFNFTLFTQAIKNSPNMVFNFSESVNADDYAFLTFKAYFWAHNYAKDAPVTVTNLAGDKTTTAGIWGQQAESVGEAKLWVTVSTEKIKDADGKVAGFKMTAPAFTDDMSWFMISDFTFTNEVSVLTKDAYAFTGNDMTAKTAAKDDGAVAAWKTVLGMTKFTDTFSTADSKFYMGFKGVDAAENVFVRFKALIWAEGGACSYANTEVYKADNTLACNTKIAYSWANGSCEIYTSEQLTVSIPTSELKDADGKVNGFIIRNSITENTSKWFMISDVTLVKEEPVITEAAITANNVTFKMGGDYGMSAYYDFDAAWGFTGHKAGWIVNDTPTKGDVNIRLSIAEETSSGGSDASRLGTVRIPDLNSPYGNERGLFNANTLSSNATFSNGIWTGKTEFLMAYDSATPTATISLIGTAHVIAQTGGIIGKLSTYDAAKDCEYFGIGWTARAYNLKSKIQIYDASNNDLGIKTSLWERTKLSCNLMGKVGETVSFTAKDGYIPVVTTASGSSVELTEGANGVYSFVMPAEAVNVTAAASTVKVNFNVNGVLKNSADVEWNEAAFTAAVPTELGTANKAIGIEYNGKLYKNAAAAFAAIGKPEGEVTVNVVAIRLETQEGASIRDSGVAGLRFTSVLGQSAYVKSYGMILTVWSNVNDAVGKDGVGVNKFTKAELEAKNYKYLEVKNSDTDFRSYEKEGNTVFNLVLSKIQDGHRELEYIARTYVTVEYEGGASETIYSDVNYASNARSAHNVATLAIQNAEASGLTSEQIAFIEENYLSKKA